MLKNIVFQFLGCYSHDWESFSKSTQGVKMMQPSASEGLLIDDIMFEEDDWSIMRATPFTQLHKAWQYIFTRSTCCSIVIYDYQRLWMRLLYYFLEFFHCMQQVITAHACTPNKQSCEHAYSKEREKLAQLSHWLSSVKFGHTFVNLSHTFQRTWLIFINLHSKVMSTTAESR